MNQPKKGDLKNIFWFAYYNEHSPSVRYRAIYPLIYFNKEYGVKYKIVIPGYTFKKIICFIEVYFKSLISTNSNSLIVIQRVNSNFIYSNLLKLLVKVKKHNTVYDTDDADYLTHDTKSIYYFARNCNKLSLGSNMIARHLSKFNNNFVLTTSPIVDLEIIKEKRSNPFTIGWIGEFGGDHKLSLINIVFPAIRKITFSLNLTIIGIFDKEDELYIREYFQTNKNIIINIPHNINWNNEFEIQSRISSFDIGIATLLNTELHLSKSGIKVKQYMNNGVPVLSVDLPENNSFINSGVNGYYCNNRDEFFQRINEFHLMSDERYNVFLKNARDSIYKFNHDSYYNSFKKLL